ncbi:hypothetical protein [Cohnella herbarum]|uniref:hypothetical protein n=1 Tax=Cohnella herbarum TaxID=2728023 RepID=UPI0020C2A0F4|nr:hypothetical protein [Cohnella herbarum]
MDGLYFQVEGRTKVSSSVITGKTLLLRFCYPLSIFGDIEFWQKVVVQSQVEAVQPSTFLFIDKRIVETELMKDPVFLNKLLFHRIKNQLAFFRGRKIGELFVNDTT